jgi:IS5 family transposase
VRVGERLDHVAAVLPGLGRWQGAAEQSNRRTGRKPRAVTADRGYGEKAADDELHDLGVRTVVIPRKGNPGAR